MDASSLNVWTAIWTRVVSLIAFVVVERLRPGRETSMLLEPEEAVAEDGDTGEGGPVEAHRPE